MAKIILVIFTWTEPILVITEAYINEDPAQRQAANKALSSPKKGISFLDKMNRINRIF
jgi:hypothetical protein